MAVNNTFEIGAILRPSFKRMCRQLGLTYKEDKQFLASFFTVYGPPNAILRLQARLRAVLAAEALEEERERQAEARYKAQFRWWNPATWRKTS